MKHLLNLKFFALFLTLSIFTPIRLQALEVLVPAGADWRYLDNGSDQGSAWQAPGFDDSGWAVGPAELGYGDGGEATVVSFGPDAGNKYTTTYFRHTFNVVDPLIYQNLVLEVVRDDGIVVYLNGTEVYRDNMPGGAVDFQTPASVAIGGADESSWGGTPISSSQLIAGNNVLAVEIHQANGTSSDISFDLRLKETIITPVIRGPYLQIGTSSSALVGWRTDVALDSFIRYGTDPGNLNMTVSDIGAKTEHRLGITGLQPSTTYYYELGSGTEWFPSEFMYFFTTSPTPGTVVPVRVWAIGDSGTADGNARAVRDAYLNFAGGAPTDVWLMLGDNAYNSGTDAEFQGAVFDMYPQLLENTFLWPTRGNHESDGGGSTYYNIFEMPTNGEAGGLASGQEAYYSFDYANVHFICLDSQGSSRSATGPMAVWLQNDLAQTSQDWVIAYWHHPPYTKGSHNSDTEGQLIDMRENILPILEAGGVDLVLSGHSHSYERSFLLDGHYGSSSTLTGSMIVDGGDGDPAGAGAYQKASSGLAAHEGAIYTVAGSSGKLGGGSLNHPVMFESLNVLGSVVLDINGNQMDAIFLDSAGVTRDHYTLLKGATSPPAAPSSLTATPGSTQVTLNWTDNSNNESGFEVFQAVDGGSYVSIGTVAANQTSVLVTDLLPSTIYHYFVRAFNGAGSADSNVATTTTLPPNNPPVASAQSLDTLEDTALLITLTATDGDGDPLTFSIDTQPSQGTLSPVVGDQVTYTPDPDYFGLDSFNFVAFDGEDFSAPATISIDVTSVNDFPVALDDSVITPQNVAVVVPVLANDTDAEGDPLSVLTVSQGASGSVVINPDNTVTYTPDAGFEGADTFDYTVSDGLEQDTGTVMVTVEVPVLFADDFESGGLTQGGWVVVNPVNVISSGAFSGVYSAQLKKSASITTTINVSGYDTLTLSYQRSTSGLNANETLVCEGSSDGNNWVVLGETFGAVPWGMQVIDISTSSSEFHVRFQVNGNSGKDAAMIDEVLLVGGGSNPNAIPVAVPDSYSVNEDEFLTIGAPGVLGNDTDGDGDPLTAVLLTGAGFGLVNLNSDGSFTYTPNADFSGVDSFSYAANDGLANSPAANVTITVDPINDAPVGNTDAYSTQPDIVLNVVAPGVLDNDTDADGDTLTANLVSGPVSGSLLTLNSDGSFSYTPNPGFTGEDSFVYTAFDGTVSSANTTVTITVQAQNPIVSLHVSSLLVESVSEGKGQKSARATVVIVDNNGDPVQGAAVTGTFSGDINEVISVPVLTDANGVAVVNTTQTTSGRNHVTFCVGNVVLGTLEYTPGLDCGQNY